MKKCLCDGVCGLSCIRVGMSFNLNCLSLKIGLENSFYSRILIERRADANTLGWVMAVITKTWNSRNKYRRVETSGKRLETSRKWATVTGRT